MFKICIFERIALGHFCCVYQKRVDTHGGGELWFIPLAEKILSRYVIRETMRNVNEDCLIFRKTLP